MRIIKHKSITWIDITNPTKKDIEFIGKNDKFHPIILDELLHTSARSKVELHPKYIFLTYHLPIFDNTVKTSRRAEIDFLITKEKIITVHYEELEPLNNFWRHISNDPRFKDRVMSDGTGQMLYHSIEEILSFSQRQMKHIEDKISNVTSELFQDKENQLLAKISYLKRDILDYSIISKPQEILLDSLKEAGSKFWGDDIKIYFSDLSGDHLKIMQYLDNFKETIEALEQTNSQLLNAHTNAIMQKFTVIAALTFPLVLVTGIFQTGVVDKINDNPLIFGVAFLSTLIFTILLLILARKKKWL
ncbi:MAG: CorA family divalent cation transporter [Patescibacteria group bacterium]